MSLAAQPALDTRPPVRSRRDRWLVPGLIFAVDIVALEASFGFGMALRYLLRSWFTAIIGVEQYLGVAAAILLLPAINAQLGLYPGHLLGPVERLRRRMMATMTVFGGLVAWDNLVARGVLSRGVLLATFAFALILPPLAELAVRAFLMRRNRWGIPVLMLGAGAGGQALTRALLKEPELGLRPIALLDNQPSYWNTAPEGVPVAGPISRAEDYESRVDAAIVCLSDLKGADVSSLFHDLNFPRLLVVPDLGGIANLWVTARPLNGYLGFEIKKNLLLRRNRILKRAMDYCIAVPLLLLSLPVWVIAAVWIKLANAGPALYRQVREGKDGQRINVWKLRTMHLEGDRILEQWLETHPDDRQHWQRSFKLPQDPRVIPVIGTVLRRTSLDELPQVWSVLRGEMSLVGPRPLPDYHLGHHTPEFRRLRTRVLPGLTGLWQVTARGNSDQQTLETLDTFYIRNWSPWLDLYILARTVTAVLMARGAY